MGRMFTAPNVSQLWQASSQGATTGEPSHAVT